MERLMHVVIMIEPALPGETLTVSQQINEVFGPFKDEQRAEEWAGRMADIYKDTRMWHIVDLSDPSVVNRLDPNMN
jgi:hypothetical protein